MMYVAVGIGGILGAILRFLITYWFNTFGSYFPIGILFVNILGCFLLGYLQGLASVHEIPDWVVTGLGTGLIGAFTTFSTFSMEVIYLFRTGRNLIFDIFISSASSIGGIT